MDIARNQVRRVRKKLLLGNLWKRMLRNVLATTITVVLSLIQFPHTPFGPAAYLAAMTTVFAHPGRRVGQLVEALSLALLGGLLGAGWSFLGLFLCSLLIESNPTAGYAIRAVFLVLGLIFHGYVRAAFPRLFTLVLLFMIECLVGLTTTATKVTSTYAAQLLYPIFMGAAAILLVNISVFPELSSRFLGTSTITSLHTTSTALAAAGEYFIQPTGTNDSFLSGERRRSSSLTEGPQHLSSTKQEKMLGQITNAKGVIREALSSCLDAQNETQFEVAIAVLPPRFMSYISKRVMGKLVSNTIAIIGSCESRYALLGDSTDEGNLSKSKPNSAPKILETDLALLKPKREISSGDKKLLRYLLSRVTEPYKALQTSITASVEVSIQCIAVAYNVTELPSGTRIRKDLTMAEIKEQIRALEKSIQKFDGDVVEALQNAAVIQGLRGQDPDVMPREEVFVVSSFLINLQQASSLYLDILKHSGFLYQRRRELGNRYRLHLPRIQWRKWIRTGGGQDESMPTRGRAKGGETTKEAHDDSSSQDESDDEHSSVQSHTDRVQAVKSPYSVLFKVPMKNNIAVPRLQSTTKGWSAFRIHFAEIILWMERSDDFKYALKLTVATMLVTWPAFVPGLNEFYSLNRGSWAALQLIFVFEVAIGTSIFSFFLRAIGTTLGSLWGWAAYEAGNGDPYICAVMLFIGFIPCYYVQLGTSYPRAGMVAVVSMAVVALSTELQSIPGTATDNFLKRWIAFILGGAVALIVEFIIVPVRARDKLVASIANAIRRISQMESCIAYGVEDGINMTAGFPSMVFQRFDRASAKAKVALGAAELFLPACSTEPRLKGSFEGLALIYREILFVLHQIVDRMDNMLLLRKTYGAGPLEELNSDVYAYRRNVAASIDLTLYAVHEALTTKCPLPQFMPSARLAHLRMVNRLREAVRSKHSRSSTDSNEVDEFQKNRARRQKYLSWNATTAASTEIIEYLEELTDLAKLLVGANEFRTGLLKRPTYDDYVGAEGIVKRHDSTESLDKAVSGETQGDILPTTSNYSLKKRRTARSSGSRGNDEIPMSLQRIQSKRQEASSSMSH